VGDVELYKETYAPLLISCIQTPVPTDQTEQSAKMAIVELEKILDSRGSEIAAFIIEPLVQGAGDMHMYHPLYITQAKALCERHGVHLIADEIMTGFGRTGTMFACEQAEITPDYMTLSKGLTGGYLPLAVVMTTDEIYSAFYCDYTEYKAFLHSHSYTGNPLACAAALATLDLFEASEVMGENKEKSVYILEKLAKFKKLPNVKEVRQAGMIAAIELQGYTPQERIGLKVYQYGLDREVLLRPLGHIVYFMPPYVISYEEIDKMIDTAYEAIASLDD
jgi:adenosylmethionine-8-amino-7-oxononanoate aminotransferase